MASKARRFSARLISSLQPPSRKSDKNRGSRRMAPCSTSTKVGNRRNRCGGIAGNAFVMISPAHDNPSGAGPAFDYSRCSVSADDRDSNGRSLEREAVCDHQAASLISGGEDMLFAGNVAQGMPPEIAQGEGGIGGEISGDQHPLMEFLGQFLQPRGAIDGGADDGEIKARWRTDIAIGDLADMEAQAEFKTPGTSGFAGQIEFVDRLTEGLSRRQRLPTGALPSAMITGGETC